MGGRSHDFHCPTCHTWIDGFSMPPSNACPFDGAQMFYDLNLDGCFNDAECWEGETGTPAEIT